jgi:tRNA threonylcarbamoyl adenosine modification protein (Sua5/YciO/YrdC/YwlC family)
MQILETNPKSWRLARQAIADGELVAFPTDTVYGVACDPYNIEAIERLYAAKGRMREKAIPLLLSSASRCSEIAGRLPEGATRLGSAFWPGALTLVVPRAANLPAELGGGDTIAVRVPDHAELRAFIESCGGALATSSANLSGRSDAVRAEQAAEYLGDSVKVIIDGGTTRGGVPSTVVNCVVDPPAILREGAIDRKRIEATLRGES